MPVVKEYGAPEVQDIAYSRISQRQIEAMVPDLSDDDLYDIEQSLRDICCDLSAKIDIEQDFPSDEEWLERTKTAFMIKKKLLTVVRREIKDRYEEGWIQRWLEDFERKRKSEAVKAKGHDMSNHDYKNLVFRGIARSILDIETFERIENMANERVEERKAAVARSISDETSSGPGVQP